MEVSGIKRTSAAEEVFQALHKAILSGTLKPGQKLPSQDELARRFAVSRNTLREAVHRLGVMGLLESKQGVGTVVHPASASSYLVSLSDHLLLQPAIVQEFLEARVFVEQSTARLAALRRTEDGIERLGDLLQRQSEAHRAGDGAAFSRYDVAFHMMLARCGRNTVFVRFLESIWDLLNRFIEEVVRLPGSTEKALRFHRRILEAVSAGRPAGAAREMGRHLWDVIQTIERDTEVELDADAIFQVVGEDPVP